MFHCLFNTRSWAGCKILERSSVIGNVGGMFIRIIKRGWNVGVEALVRGV